VALEAAAAGPAAGSSPNTRIRDKISAKNRLFILFLHFFIIWCFGTRLLGASPGHKKAAATVHWNCRSRISAQQKPYPKTRGRRTNFKQVF
jgi:hypothetical protein